MGREKSEEERLREEKDGLKVCFFFKHFYWSIIALQWCGVEVCGEKKTRRLGVVCHSEEGAENSKPWPFP